MARKSYSEEFRRQAIDLDESTPGATVRGIAEDLAEDRLIQPSCSASRRASVRPVSTGLAEPTVGNAAWSPIYTLPTWCRRPLASATEVAGSSPIQRVPASW